MKKLVSSVLVCSVVAASAMMAVFAEEPMLTASAPAGISSVQVGNETLDLNGHTPYIENGHVMVPLRAVAEKLGFQVTWDEAKQGITLDNHEVNTTVYIGENTYYMASSTAIGMSAPTPLGAAPALCGDTTYVPIEMFGILCGQDAYTVKDGSIVFAAEENVQIPNPFTDYQTVEEAQKALSFTAKVPGSLPDSYRFDAVQLLGNDFIQVFYKNGDHEILYRMAKGDEDISGDYNVYTDVKTVTVGDVSVTVRRGGEHTTGAIWTDQGYSFSVYADSDLTEDAVLAIVKSVR